MKPPPFVRAMVTAAAVSTAVGALGAPQRLDDSASPRRHVAAQSVTADSGVPLLDAAFATSAVLRFGLVDFRLATAHHMGRQARIYFVLPPLVPGLHSPAALRVEWRGTGRFAPGSGAPGGRHLVWSGQVSEPWMSESVDLTATLDLTQVDFPPDGRFGFEAYFEIEVQP